jgi:hypothetical protein
MFSGMRYVIAMGIIVAAGLGPGVPSAAAQQPLRIEGTYPRQAPIGERTVINVVLPTMEEFTVEVAPAAGVTAASTTRGESFQGNNTWWGSPSTSVKMPRRASGR